MQNIYGMVRTTSVARCAQGLLAAWLFAISAFCSPTHAQTAIPVAVDPCATCGTALDLRSEAQNYFNQWDDGTPPGYAGIIGDAGTCFGFGSTASGATTLLVVSTKIAISATFYACWAYPHGLQLLRVIPITGGSNADAVSADNLLMARALADAGKVVLPPNLPFVGGGGTSFDGLWDLEVSNVLLRQDTAGQSEYWHGVLDMLSQMLTATYTVVATGVEFQVWAGDTIIVTDSNGYTAMFQYTPGAPTKWTYVPNSIRDPKGNSVPNTGSNLPTPGGISEPGGAINVSLGGGGFDQFWILPIYDSPTPGGVVIVGSPTNTVYPDGYIACPTITCTALQ